MLGVGRHATRQSGAGGFQDLREGFRSIPRVEEQQPLDPRVVRSGIGRMRREQGPGGLAPGEIEHVAQVQPRLPLESTDPFLAEGGLEMTPKRAHRRITPKPPGIGAFPSRLRRRHRRHTDHRQRVGRQQVLRRRQIGQAQPGHGEEHGRQPKAESHRRAYRGGAAPTGKSRLQPRLGGDDPIWPSQRRRFSVISG